MTDISPEQIAAALLVLKAAGIQVVPTEPAPEPVLPREVQELSLPETIPTQYRDALLEANREIDAALHNPDLSIQDLVCVKWTDYFIKLREEINRFEEPVQREVAAQVRPLLESIGILYNNTRDPQNQM